MTIAPLTLISAGAGSGKTHEIQTRLGRWIMQGDVRPDRIVAVTFTEAAAAELRSRIRAELVRANRFEDALRLDQSYMSTIHGFGLRLITEFAFDAGLAPLPHLLDEHDEDAMIRRALAHAPSADTILGNLRRYGYVGTFWSGSSAEDSFRTHLLDAIARHREIGRFIPTPDLIRHAEDWIRTTYGKTDESAGLDQSLSAAVAALLKEFPQALDGAVLGNKTATDSLHRDYQNLKEIEGGKLDDWSYWEGLRTMRQSNKKTKLPSGYDDLAAVVMAAADKLPVHPGPRADALAHARALLGAAQEALQTYADAKRETALVDYTDMLALAHELLAKPEVINDLKGRIDCLVIDEFQDTNPLQFALLWHLRNARIPALIVGDTKQAIMGFQGADPRLFEALAGKHPESVHNLEANWRTQPSLMGLLNDVGAKLFSDTYVNLVPRAGEGHPLPLEVVELSGSVPRGLPRGSVFASHVAVRIKRLLDDPTQFVNDRVTKQKRRLRPGDIAILCPKRKQRENYAEILRGLGIRCRLEEDGWVSTPEIQIAQYALAFVADPSDRFAALYLAVTELGANTLEGALKILVAGRELEDSILHDLKKAAGGPTDRCMADLVADTLGALRFYDLVAEWPNAAQARANLLRFQAEASAFDAARREALANGGIFGSGARSFLAWLNSRLETRDGDMQPEPRVSDDDAVTLMTWHGSKGLEWPIVAVCGWDSKVEPRLPDLRVEFDDFSNLESILDSARIRFIPTFAADKTKEKFSAPLAAQSRLDAIRLIYVALTRAREKLILEWPSYQDGKDYESYYSILRELTGAELKTEDKAPAKKTSAGLVLGDKRYSCLLTKGGGFWPAGYDPDRAIEADVALSIHGRRALRPGALPAQITPDILLPSSVARLNLAPAAPDKLRIEKYGPGLAVDLGLDGQARGVLLHRCFEVLMAKPDAAPRLADITGFPLVTEQSSAISKAVADFREWLDRSFPGATLSSEVPVIAFDETGSVITGTIDLLVETRDGFWILDHKSDRAADPEQSFAAYWPQLWTYARAIAKARPEKAVVGVGINWLDVGLIGLRSF